MPWSWRGPVDRRARSRDGRWAKRAAPGFLVLASFLIRAAGRAAANFEHELQRTPQLLRGDRSFVIYHVTNGLGWSPEAGQDAAAAAAFRG